MERGKIITSTTWRALAQQKMSVGAMLLTLTASGCGRDNGTAAIAAVHDGSAEAAIQRHFDARPECAPVLEFSRKSGLLEASEGNAGAAALVTAGLLESVPGRSRPDRRAYRPSPAARKWFRNVDPARRDAPYLCFAHRKVRTVSLVPDGDMPTLRYTFTLEDPPRWMARPEMIAAFPGVALAYGNIFASDESVRFEKGLPIFDVTYMNWLNPGFNEFGVNFRGYTIPELVDSKKIAGA